jgi:uncharacterized protein YjbI with pentapeptide repeats
MHNFRNQDLRGCSFRDKNLLDADFTGADVRGADFRGANLTRAKFCQARMGKTKRRNVVHLFESLLLGIVITILSFSGYKIFFSYPDSLLGKFPPNVKEYFIFLVPSCYLLGLVTCLLIALKKQTWSILWGYIVIFAATVLGAGVETTPLPTFHGEAETIAIREVYVGGGILGNAIMNAVMNTITVVAAGVVGLAGAAMTPAAVVAAVMLRVIVEGMLLFTGIGEGGMAVLMAIGAMGGKGFWSESAATIFVSFFGLYINYRCLKYEEPMLSPLRRLTLKWRSWGGTQFAGAILLDADFSKADLKHTRFTGSKLIRCNFHKAKNLHLANTLNTVLEPLAVRQMVLDAKTSVRNFDYYNLRGMVFSHLDLQGINFYHADISEADFRGCNLTDCDLTETMALGTLFNNANFTGATIDNWSIDKTTQFNRAHCDFVYLKRDKSERNPPQGEFKDGDFAKLYQEIANTVDFIAHTPAELQALLRAIEKIKADGGEIFIQQMERKADSVVIRVQSEGDIEPDKAAIYAEVQQQKETELKALRQEFEQKYLTQQNELEKEKIRSEAKTEQVDLLAGLLKEAIKKPTVINSGKIGEINMNDNSRSIHHATIQNSAVNLGDNSTITNTIQQLPESQSELKDLLLQLVALLEKSQIPNTDKQKVGLEIKNLAEIAPKPADERKSAGSKIIGTMKDLTSIFKELPDVAIKYGDILAKLVLMF